MVYIKKLVMHGFKSFAKKTELVFSDAINVIVGPNGSGKSNISDALCFVLGRLSIKSMRAAKAKNLLFLGSKLKAPSKEAVVELVFDNSDKVFSIDKKEVSIKRIVRKNGQGIYKINNETKTRQEILALLAQAGIDPNGFNIILQGEIQNLARMYPEERRKIIEEVSGIAIYESRKQKSLKELNKTEDKLKEVSAILRERTSYLNHLEKERQEALRYKKLKQNVRIYKASIFNYDLVRSRKKKQGINSQIEDKDKKIKKIKDKIKILDTNISNLEFKIKEITSVIQKSTGLEQEKLNKQIVDFNAEIAGLKVRISNYESKRKDFENQKKELNQIIEKNKNSLRELSKSNFKNSGLEKRKEIESKKLELEKLEAQRKKFYVVKSELKSVKEKIDDKNSLLKEYFGESDLLIKQIKSLSEEIHNKSITSIKVNYLKQSLKEKKELLESLNKREIELERISSASENEIEKQKKLIEKISKMDVCPLCKSKITREHVNSIRDEIRPQINSLQKKIESADKNLSELYSKRKILKEEIDELIYLISQGDSDLIRLENIKDKKNQVKNLQGQIQTTKREIFELEKIRKRLEKNINLYINIEQKYETALIEVQEISIRNEENIGSEISFKQKELDHSNIALKQIIREEEDLDSELNNLKVKLIENEKLLEKKNSQEQALTKKFENMLSKRDSFQNSIKEYGKQVSEQRNLIYNLEQDKNNFKIEKAKYDAITENLENELSQFSKVKMINLNKDILLQKLNKTQSILDRLGSVNLRSLETYDSIKKEYSSIKEKADIIVKEKEGVLKIISEIDIKKKKTFLVTLKKLNEIFMKNFSQLSSKGQVSLELENKKDPFEGGVNIFVKIAHGKYFDIKSLSGGEQTLVALSLIFAIQDLNPYYFYILDEIDSALDKRNSERLAHLLRNYISRGQYIIITHNDEIMSNATTLYGVSMHDRISKIISLKDI